MLHERAHSLSHRVNCRTVESYQKSIYGEGKHQGRKGEKAQRQNREARAGNIKSAHDDVLTDIFCRNIKFKIKKKKRQYWRKQYLSPVSFNKENGKFPPSPDKENVTPDEELSA